MLEREALEPLDLVGAGEALARGLAEVVEHGRVTLPRVLELVAGGELGRGVLAYRRQKPVARCVGAVHHLHERPIDQPAEKIEHLGRGHGAVAADDLRRGQREAASKHPQPAKEQLLLGLEQLMAPLERVLQGPMTVGAARLVWRSRPASRSRRSAI